jgi:peptide/nickel transport system substrate-binding protein
MDEIHVSVPYDFDTLDPHARNTISNFAIASNFYEPLVRTDAALKIQPALAKSWQNPDLLTWVFELQPDARFHSGKPVAAEDVVYSFHRLLDHPELEMRSYLVNIKDVTALDPHRVQVRTRKPVSVFLNRLNFVLIVPRDSSTEALASREDGTGPYMLESWKKGKSLRLKRFGGYWGKAPAFASVTFELSRTPQQALEDAQTGKSHLVQSNSRDMATFVKNSVRYRMLLHDSLFVKYLGFDMEREVTPYCDTATNPFRNPLVRQAIRSALDLRRLTSRLSSYSTPASQLVPSFVFGFNPSLAPAEYQFEKAKQLMVQAGYPQGFSVTMNARKTLVEAAQEVKDQLQLLNVRVEVNALSSGDFYNAIDRGDVSFYLTGWGCPTGDASNVFEDAIHTRDDPTQFGSSNFGGYSNPAIDRAIEASADLVTDEARQSEFQRIMAAVMQDLPWIPLYVDQEAYAVDNSLSWTPRNDSYVFAFEIGTKQ